MANACNAVWTRTRASLAGYILPSTLCELCGQHEDTIHGRVWKSQHPEVKRARKKVAPAPIREAALRAGPTCALYNRGLTSHPASDYPAVSCDTTCEYFERGKNTGAKVLSVQGKLCVDGSCDQHIIRSLRRASWSVVQIDDDGEEIVAVRGTVPAFFVQSSQAGEYATLSAALQLMAGPSTIFSDCANVVRDWARPNSDLRLKSVFGGLMASVRKEPNATFLTEVVKVKAHQSLSALKASGPSEALTLGKGNDAADRHAKAALKRHQQPTADQARELKKLTWHATIACRTIAATLPHWPKLEKSAERGPTPGPANEPSRFYRRQHS